jgi:hypothetical protein
MFLEFSPEHFLWLVQFWIWGGLGFLLTDYLLPPWVWCHHAICSSLLSQQCGVPRLRVFRIILLKTWVLNTCSIAVILCYISKETVNFCWVIRSYLFLTQAVMTLCVLRIATFLFEAAPYVEKISARVVRPCGLVDGYRHFSKIQVACFFKLLYPPTRLNDVTDDTTAISQDERKGKSCPCA